MPLHTKFSTGHSNKSNFFFTARTAYDLDSSHVPAIGGKIAMLGIPSPTEMSIDWRHVIFNHLTLSGVYGREMYETWYKMTVMLQSGLKIDEVITHCYNWRDFEQGFQAMRTGNSGKVILDWTDVS